MKTTTSDVTLRASYVSADEFPGKLLHIPAVRQLKPVHVQWIPTNRCNLRCPFCSCHGRDASQQMQLDVALQVIREFAELGTLAVTITGGGEPLCHPGVGKMIHEFRRCGIKVGLVTNGLMLGVLDANTINALTWCRISNSDHRSLTTRYRQLLERVTEARIDWAFSHVVSATPNLPEIGRIVDFANEHGFTHVRLVADLLHPEDVSFVDIKEYLAGRDGLVIYQPRKRYLAGSQCLIGYVKPVVAADFRMYLCCGVQYALEDQQGGLPDELSMGSALDLGAVYDQPHVPFPVRCDRCYYSGYNTVLQAMVSDMHHMEFV